jgi:NADP-dependent 3-hydroxy acid dehydrogenase YdfG
MCDLNNGSMHSLKNQVAVVTGASSGIGKSIALALAKQGVVLCLLGRHLNSLEAVAHIAEQSTSRVYCYRVDLTIGQEIVDFHRSISAKLDAVDILVHSAGVISMGPLESASVEDFDLQFQTNVRGPYLLTQILLPLLKVRQGQIIFINSRAVFLDARPGLGQYTATKQALKALADSFRQEVNTDGIRVVSVYPGRTSSPMQQRVFKVEGKIYQPELLMQPDDVAAAIVDMLSLPITAEVTDITIRPMAELL